MYARNGPKGGEEAEKMKQENGCGIGRPEWSCTSDHADATTFFPPISADQNQRPTKLQKHVPCIDDLGMWISRFVTVGGLNGEAERVTSNVIQLPQSEKNKAAVAGRIKRKRGNKGNGNSSKKDLMEIYRISRPSGSKDRHSKVATARGPRDRRMRLSVDTAVKFFHLQDRLGFDQPSKAVEWLIEKCTSAIDDLPQISHSEYLSHFNSGLSTPINTTQPLVMNCERKRGRNPKLRTLSTKPKERDEEGSKRRRRGQGKVSSEMETMKLGQGLLQMRCGDPSGIRTLDSLHRGSPYFNNAHYSPEPSFQSYPSNSSVQSADSTTTFSCPFPRVMPSITIDPQTTMPNF